MKNLFFVCIAILAIGIIFAIFFMGRFAITRTGQKSGFQETAVAPQHEQTTSSVSIKESVPPAPLNTKFKGPSGPPGEGFTGPSEQPPSEY